MKARNFAVEQIRTEVHHAVLGLEHSVDLVLTALLARGHVLLEDIPGVGKTIMAQAFARSVQGTFRRIQFTSDMLPSDIIGVHIWRPDHGRFEFREGPIFANFVLADEINRGNPKTQSALLEVMSEEQVSLDHQVYPLPRPFFIIATQNPIEFHGTFPLPESQKDRFLMTIDLGYPEAQVEQTILTTPSPQQLVERVRPIATTEDILAMQHHVERIQVHPDLLDYVVRLSRATREHPEILLGVSPRAGKHLIAAARALAWVSGRDYVIPDDIKSLCLPVWTHRIVPRIPPPGSSTVWARKVMEQIIERVPVPV